MYETESPTTFPGSSAVERSAVNRLVVGSNPTRGDSYLRREFPVIGELYLTHVLNQVALDHDPPIIEWFTIVLISSLNTNKWRQ